MSEESELEILKLRDDIGHESNIRVLIRLCYLAVGDDDLFSRRVDLLLRQLPTAIKTSERFKKKLDECTITLEPRWQYKYNCGYPMGTPENPVMMNDPDDSDYDPKQPTYPISPVLVQDEPYTDWMAVFELCVDEFEAQGTTWHKEKEFGVIKGGAT